MNEVITRLNEIEEKAGAIIEEAKNKKSQMQKQLILDLQGIDQEYEAKEAQQLKELERQLRSEAAKEMEQTKEENEQKKAAFLAEYEKKKDQLADEIFARIIGEG